MKKIGIVLIAFFIFNAVLAQTPIQKYGQLQLIDKQLCDEKGNPVQLRGMSSHGLGWFPACMTESSIEHLATVWKIDVLRLALYTQNYAKEPQKMLDFIDKLVDITEKKGLYCMIDWHVLEKGNPNTEIENAKVFWKHIANKHANKKHVIFEICNEPNGKEATWAEIGKFADEIIPIIREKDKKSIIIVGTPRWSSDLKAAVEKPLSYKNIMYAFHFYAYSHKTYDEFKEASKHIPIFVSEWGTTHADGSQFHDFESSKTWLSIFDGDNPNKTKISWIAWSLGDKDELSAVFKPGSCKEANWNNLTEGGEFYKSLFQPEKCK